MEISKKNVLVPRLMDNSNLNAQNLNAKAMLARFDSPDIQWHTVYISKPDPQVCSRDNVTCHRLGCGRFWTWHLILLYLRKYDAIFYPGNEWYDAKALLLRKWLRRRARIIGTLEGIPWKQGREDNLSDIIGHKVYTFNSRSGETFSRSFDCVRNLSDHIIAISPFLEKIGKNLYGDKFTCLPLGIEKSVFQASNCRKSNPPIVIGAGTLYEAKRPECFIKLAKALPQAKFVWYGDGPDREKLLEEIRKNKLNNILFPGAIHPEDLAEKLRQSSLFVLPSKSEGVPKVTQEAAASGIPIVLFGFYETPSVINGENGFVVWDDSELLEKVSELISNPHKAQKMGENGARMAERWDWDSLADRWQYEISKELFGNR